MRSCCMCSRFFTWVLLHSLVTFLRSCLHCSDLSGGPFRQMCREHVVTQTVLQSGLYSLHSTCSSLNNCIKERPTLPDYCHVNNVLEMEIQDGLLTNKSSSAGILLGTFPSSSIHLKALPSLPWCICSTGTGTSALQIASSCTVYVCDYHHILLWKYLL